MAYKIYYTLKELEGALKQVRHMKEKMLDEEVRVINLFTHLKSHSEKIRRSNEVFISEHGEIVETGIHPRPYKKIVKKEKAEAPKKESSKKQKVPYWVTQREGKPYEVRG